MQFFRQDQVIGNVIEGNYNLRVMQLPDFMFTHLKYILTINKKNKSDTSNQKEKKQRVKDA